MKFICKTCGGSCAAVNSLSDAVTYKCQWCGNIYVVRKGEENLYTESKKAVFKAEQTAEKIKENNVTPRTMPQINVQKSTFLSGEEVFARNINSVIELRTQFNGRLYSGSGYAVGSGGIAITNAHVVTSNKKIMSGINAYVCGKTLPAEVIKLCENDDLALIRIKNPPAAMKSVKFADINKVQSGQVLYVIGNSLGSGTCITSGIVSDKRRMVAGKPRLMTDCAVNKGNSGGPVFNNLGEVVGTVTAVTTEAEGMNYAIPADVVINFLSSCGIKI